VRSEQRPGRDAEILFARSAAEARCALRAAAIVGVNAAAVGANRLAIRVRPADVAEHRLCLRVAHADDLNQRQALGGSRK
jgi:hypothetical protein